MCLLAAQEQSGMETIVKAEENMHGNEHQVTLQEVLLPTNHVQKQ